MAHPLFVIEQAMRQFSSQWYSGLRPSLEVQTKYDGSLVVNSTVFCSNMPSSPQFPFSSTPKSKRAMKNARYRHNKARKMEQKSRTTADVETQCSNQEDALNNESKKIDSGFKEASHETSTVKVMEQNESIPLDLLENDLGNDKSTSSTGAPSNSLEGMVFPDKKVTSVPNEVSSNSIVASYHCESCHKELDRAMDHPPNNLTCEDCCNEQRRLDPNEEIRYEENPPRCSSCTEENLCQGCEEAMEKFFSYLISCLGQEKNVSRRKKKNKKKICPFCTDLKDWYLDNSVEQLIDTLTDGRIVRVKDSPCKDCMRLLYNQNWFSLEEAYNSVTNIYT